MSKTAYLTIDDSPTTETDRLTEFLAARDIPAVLYCIGGDYTDLGVPCVGIETMPDPLVRAAERGFLLGNHCYSHTRSSTMTYEAVVAEIEKTETLIDGIYRRANKTRPAKVLRFPHLDRGTGGWIVDYDKAGPHGEMLKKIFSDGLNIKLTPPTPQQLELKEKLQAYLKREGFSSEGFRGVTFPWYAQTEMAQARDALYTYSTADWMLNPKFTEHAKKWPCQTLDDLKRKIDNDVFLRDEKSAHIILAHDHDGLFDTVTALVEHLTAKGFAFVAYG